MTLHLRRPALLLALSTPVVAALVWAQQAVTQRFPQLENDDVKVWKSVIAPGAPLSPHRHEHGRVLIALAGGTERQAPHRLLARRGSNQVASYSFLSSTTITTMGLVPRLISLCVVFGGLLGSQ